MRTAAGYCLVLLSILGTLCSGKDRLAVERWEGLRFGAARVYVRMQIPEQLEGKPEEAVKEVVMAVARSRGDLLIKCHVISRMNRYYILPDEARIITAALSSAKIIHYRCDDGSCEMIADFPVKELLEFLESEKPVPEGGAAE